MPHTSMQVTYKEYNMKFNKLNGTLIGAIIYPAIFFAMIITLFIILPMTAKADGKPASNPKVNWFVSTQVDKSVGTSSYFDGSLFDKKLKPYGDDKEVYNPHIKDWFVDVKITDAQGNVTGFQRMYSHSIVRFMDANGEVYNITFKRTPVVK